MPLQFSRALAWVAGRVRTSKVAFGDGVNHMAKYEGKGKARHMDEKADKALIKKMVKPADLKKGGKKK